MVCLHRMFCLRLSAKHELFMFSYSCHLWVMFKYSARHEGGRWGKMEVDGLYGEYDRNPLPQISVRVRGQNVAK